MNSIIALVNALTAPLSLSALKSVLLAMVGATQEFYFEKTITPAEILASYTTPIDLVPAQGANTIIVPTSITAQMIYGTTPYATNGNIQIFNGGNRIIGAASNNGLLFGTISRTVNISIPQIASSATDTQYVANSPLTLTVDTGNPTAGDSPVTLRGFYKVITVS